jgi:hypothetical protein
MDKSFQNNNTNFQAKKKQKIENATPIELIKNRS